VYALTRSWSKELGGHGIRVVGIAPGVLEATGLRTPDYERALVRLHATKNHAACSDLR
jgi:sorbitol-6-phosphate 2-dehydrogenase